MEKNVINSINAFIGKLDTDVVEKKHTPNNPKEVILNEREGLIERIDKRFVTSDGRILLREQY